MIGNRAYARKFNAVRSRKIRESARGKECTIRGPMCNGNPETTVWAHSPLRSMHGGGIAYKASDIFGCRCCSACHDWLDGRVQYDGPCETKTMAFFRGFSASLQQLVDEGIVVVR